MESFPISNINSYDDLEITQLGRSRLFLPVIFLPFVRNKKNYVINVFILILHVHETVTMKNSVFVVFGKD